MLEDSSFFLLELFSYTSWHQGRFGPRFIQIPIFGVTYTNRGVQKMTRIFVLLSLALLVSAPLQAQGSAAANQLSEGNITKESSADHENALSPREYIESRLGGKIIKLERDPDVLLRAVLLVDRKGWITQHVLEVGLDSETDLRDVRIVTPTGNSMGVPPLVVMPRSLISQCWSHCKDKCGQDSDCRLGCLFDCIVA